MAYYKRRYKRKLTTQQQLARYKRKQEAYRKKLEMQRKEREEAVKPGGRLNPLTPKWCSFDTYKTISLGHNQRRYRGTTYITAFRKGTEPNEWSCPMQGHTKIVTPTQEDHKAWMSYVGNVQFGKRHYKHPITIVSYEQFCKEYVVVERFNRYLD